MRNGIVLALNKQRVRRYWCMVLGTQCTMIPSQLYIRWYLTIMAMAYGFALVLMLIEYMERYRVGFGRTASKLVLVHVWIWMCHCLVYDVQWHHHNCTLACYSTTIAMTYGSALVLMFIECIWNGVMLVSNEQDVCWYWWMFEFECAIAWYTINHDTIACTLACYSNTMATAHGCILMLMLIEYMERGTASSCWLWTNRRQVFLVKNSTLILVYILECVITWYPMHHDTITIAHFACYLTPMNGN